MLRLNEREVRFAAAVLLLVLIGLLSRQRHLRARRAPADPVGAVRVQPAVR